MPNTLLWDVTKKCNLRCLHCYNASKYFQPFEGVVRPPRDELTTSEALHAIEVIRHGGFSHIHLLGGEPLARPDLPQIIHAATERGLRVTMNSNGLLLTPPLLAELDKAGCTQIAFSLDGGDADSHDFVRGHGTFDRTVSNIRMACDYIQSTHSHLTCVICCVITQRNLDTLVQLPALASSLGVSLVDLTGYYAEGYGKTNSAILNVDAYTMLQHVEAVVRNAWVHHPNIRLQIDMRPRMARYLNLRYGHLGVRVSVTFEFADCAAGTRLWILEADGHLHPCGCMSVSYGQPALQAGGVQLEWIDIRNITEWNQVAKSEYACSFLRFKSTPAIYSKLKTCHDCPVDTQGICHPDLPLISVPT